MDQLEERMARVEAAISQLDQRLTEWINHFTAEIEGLRSDLRRFEERVDSRFNQLFYAVITSWVTIIAALLVAIFK